MIATVIKINEGSEGNLQNTIFILEIQIDKALFKAFTFTITEEK